MASYNKVLLLGNLTRDPELRSTPTGLAICKFSIACSRVFKGQDGESKEETTFIDIDAFGRQAEVIDQYFSKGKPIFVEGRLRLNQWEDKNSGEKRNKLSVTLESFQFIGSRNDSNSDYESTTPSSRTEQAGSTVNAGAGADTIDDDVPF